MDDLTTLVFQELFKLPEERSHASAEIPEVEIQGEHPAGTPAIRVAHNTILSEGFSKVMGPTDGRIDYSRLRTDGTIEYRSLTWGENKKITPDSITDSHTEDPFPSEIVEGTPLGMA